MKVLSGTSPNKYGADSCFSVVMLGKLDFNSIE